MAWLRQIWNTFRLGALDRELEEEVRYHLDLFERHGKAAGAAKGAEIHHFAVVPQERMGD